MIILLLIYIALVALFASEEARADAIDIRNGKPIRHADAWKERACVAGFGAVIISAMHLFWVWGLGVFLWHFAGLCIVAYGAFTPVFRWRLNRLRVTHPLYIAPWSNKYDHFMWSIPNFFKAEPWDWTEVGIRYHQGNAKWHKSIHRAGFIAYAVEGLALLIGCGITLAH